MPGQVHRHRTKCQQKKSWPQACSDQTQETHPILKQWTKKFVFAKKLIKTFRKEFFLSDYERAEQDKMIDEELAQLHERTLKLLKE